MSNKITNTNYDLIVIGAGSGGVRAARIAANYGAKVAIVESVRVGGTCVLRGCVPKKLLVYGSHFASEIEDSKGFGWDISAFKHDWSKLINNKNNELDRLNKIYLNLLSKVTIINGFAKITGNNQVEVNGQVLSAKSILIAVGGKSYMPDIDGNELCINSDEALDLEMLPKSIVINGGGYIALEFAGIFSSFGSKVTLVYRGKNILRGFDSDISKFKIPHAGMDDYNSSDVVLRYGTKKDGLYIGISLNLYKESIHIYVNVGEVCFSLFGGRGNFWK